MGVLNDGSTCSTHELRIFVAPTSKTASALADSEVRYAARMPPLGRPRSCRPRSPCHPVVLSGGSSWAMNGSWHGASAVLSRHIQGRRRGMYEHDPLEGAHHNSINTACTSAQLWIAGCVCVKHCRANAWASNHERCARMSTISSSTIS